MIFTIFIKIWTLYSYIKKKKKSRQRIFDIFIMLTYYNEPCIIKFVNIFEKLNKIKIKKCSTISNKSKSVPHLKSANISTIVITTSNNINTGFYNYC